MDSQKLEQLDLDLPNLRILSLRSCKNLQSIDFLSKCKKLEAIDISYCINLKDIEVLRQLPLLRKIYAGGYLKPDLSVPFPKDVDFHSGVNSRPPSLSADFDEYLR